MGNFLEQFPADWKEKLVDKFSRENITQIANFLSKEKENQEIIYPSENNIFQAFRLCSWKDLKIVIIGQDPYHNPEQANGLSFSVPKSMEKLPPSLRNIYQELQTDLQIKRGNGDLSDWAKQGILLLNSTLTVRKNEPNSHQNCGWQKFTDEIIQQISREKSFVIFVLWGKFANQKIALIDEEKHCILTASHPSPFSAYRGFFGCRHFSKINEILTKKGGEIINW